jgi:bacterioferritin
MKRVYYNQQEEIESKERFLSLSKQADSPDLKWILERIANREIHYSDLKKFIEENNLLEKDYSKIISAFTVGSLFKKGAK